MGGHSETAGVLLFEFEKEYVDARWQGAGVSAQIVLDVAVLWKGLVKW